MCVYIPKQNIIIRKLKEETVSIEFAVLYNKWPTAALKYTQSSTVITHTQFYLGKSLNLIWEMFSSVEECVG